MNTLYPIFLKVEHTPVLVVGGGKISEQKVRGMLEVNAHVTVISPLLTEYLHSLSVDGRIIVHRREYQKGDVEGFVLIFAATNNSDVHREIFHDAASRNIPVNVVDVPALCNFYLASTFQNGDLKVAVSTNGKSPTLGKIIRDRIAAEFGKGYPELLDTIGEIRPYVHSAFSEPEKRKEVLEKIVDDELKKHSVENVVLNGGKNPDQEKIEFHSQRNGKVILVGAGPGDPGLISVKGLRAIQSADVLVYDALICPELLFSAKQNCEKIFVGKRSNNHFVLQEQINVILIAKAKEGKVVVRLKGGDPFVFGRGGEELLALREEGIPTEIIPGITSGIGIPSSLGIPLTHRGTASSVVFVTGSEISDKGNAVDWQNISAIDTIVVYMGIKKLPEIITKLSDSGRNIETPVAVIFGGTTKEQIVVKGTLSTIVENVCGVSTDAPGIIIIGDVVDVPNRVRNLAKVSHLSV